MTRPVLPLGLVAVLVLSTTLAGQTSAPVRLVPAPQPSVSEAPTPPTLQPAGYPALVLRQGTPTGPLTPTHEPVVDPDAPLAAHAPWLGSGLLAQFDVRDCLINELGLDCDTRQGLLIGVPYDRMILLTVIETQVIQVDGEPVEIDVAYEFRFSKQARDQTLFVGDYDLLVEVDRQDATLDFRLAPDSPTFAIHDPVEGFDLRAHLVDDDTLLLVLDADEVRSYELESLGILQTATIEPVGNGKREARLTVEVVNYGDLPVDYLVTVTDLPDHLVPVTARTVVVQPTETATLVFELEALDGLTGSETCTVTLAAPRTGRVYDQLTGVLFPVPPAP